LTVFGTVNVLRVCTKDVGPTCFLKAEGNVLGQLATHGDDDALCHLELVNVHYTLVAQFFEVKSLGTVEISAKRLGVVLCAQISIYIVKQGVFESAWGLGCGVDVVLVVVVEFWCAGRVCGKSARLQAAAHCLSSRLRHTHNSK